MTQTTTTRFKQRGGALITALSILLILTVLGVSAMSTTALQERMAGNARDAEVAFEAAEAGIRAGELYIDSISTTTDFGATGGTGGKFTARPSGTIYDKWEDPSFDWTTAPQYSSFSLSSNKPQFIIQIVDADLGKVDDITTGASYGSGNSGAGTITVFQITARGYGLSSTSRVMLQTYYGKIF